MKQLVLSLFPGIGLLDRAFELEGFQVLRGPDPIWGGDIRRFHVEPGLFPGIIGGPPCQEFSQLSHLVRHNGLTPKWGNLIPEYERVVGEAKPAWFLMENVRQAPLPAVEGYVVRDYLLNNRWVGGTQHRVRRFSFGTRDGRELDISPDLVIFEAADFQWSVYAGHGPSPSQRDKIRMQANRRHLSGKNVLPRDKSGALVPLVIMLELQGLPKDFLDNCPFTMNGKKAGVANGVPQAIGRALARAVKRAMMGE